MQPIEYSTRDGAGSSRPMRAIRRDILKKFLLRIGKEGF